MRAGRLRLARDRLRHKAEEQGVERFKQQFKQQTIRIKRGGFDKRNYMAEKAAND